MAKKETPIAFKDRVCKIEELPTAISKELSSLREEETKFKTKADKLEELGRNIGFGSFFFGLFFLMSASSSGNYYLAGSMGLLFIVALCVLLLSDRESSAAWKKRSKRGEILRDFVASKVGKPSTTKWLKNRDGIFEPEKFELTVQSSTIEVDASISAGKIYIYSDS